MIVIQKLGVYFVMFKIRLMFDVILKNYIIFVLVSTSIINVLYDEILLNELNNNNVDQMLKKRLKKNNDGV